MLNVLIGIMMFESVKPSLDIVPFLQIIKSTGEPIKAPIEESRLVEAVRDVQRKAESCTRPKAVEVPS